MDETGYTGWVEGHVQTKPGLSQTLIGHTLDVHYHFQQKILGDDGLDEVNKQLELPREVFMNIIFHSIHFHDIGKLTKQYQAPGGNKEWVAHTLFGLPLMKHVSYPELNQMYREILETQVKAQVLGHQYPLRPDAFKWKRYRSDVNYLVDAVKKHREKASVVHEKLFKTHFPLYTPHAKKECCWRALSRDARRMAIELVRITHDKKQNEIHLEIQKIVSECDLKARDDFQKSKKTGVIDSLHVDL